MGKIIKFIKKKYAKWWWDTFMTPGRFLQLYIYDDLKKYGDKMNEKKPLTVNEMLEILNELKQKGHGDKTVTVEYEDSGNITCPLPTYEISEQYNNIVFDGWD